MVMNRAALATAIVSTLVLAGSPPMAEAGRVEAAGPWLTVGGAGDLAIDGTALGEELVIDVDPTAGVARISYDADTADPVNEVETVSFAGPVRAVRGDLGAGDDRIEIRGLDIGGELVLDLGTGLDEVLLVDVSTGDDLSLTAGSGHDQLWMFDVEVGDRWTASLGFGNDLVVFAGGGVTGRTTIIGSRGGDRVSLSEADFAGLLSFIAGRGEDDFRLFLSTTQRVRFIGDDGRDAIHVADTVIGGSSWFAGQAGLDSFTSSGTTTFAVPPTVIGIP